MKRMFVMAMVWTGLTVPLVAVAQSGNAMDDRGASMMSGDHGVPMMAGERGMPGPRAMAGMSEGEVRRVDETVGKLTLRHGPLANLGMPAMTMVFRVKDPAWLAQLKVGDKVRFVAERVDGNLAVTALKVERKLSPYTKLATSGDSSS